jgi:hypothetical protein
VASRDALRSLISRRFLSIDNKDAIPC